MSVSGPCLWLPSPAAPPSHLAAISTPSSAWNNQDQTNPRLSSTESHHHHHHHHLHSNPNTIHTSANNDHHHSLLPSVASTLAASTKLPSPYHSSSGYELMPPPKDTVDDRAVDNATGDDDHQPLSRTRLDKLNRRDSLLTTAAASTSRKDAVSPSSPLEVVSPDRKRKRHDDSDRQDGMAEGDMTSSEDGACSPGPGGGGQASSNSRLEKKKMKRFRLTHNQTRFLMSEFTRQAHPDAAHRERLSKEIPGLTPRQVQVWFQNRRAKLKRLTTNDRERMLKSRALPDDFDTTQVLRTPFDHKSTSETSILLTSGLQRSEDEYAMSPLSAPSAGGSYFSGSTERQDGYPTSSLNRPGVPAGLADMQRSGRAYPFSRSSSLSDAYSGIPQLPSRFSSPSTDSLGHPGMPYARRPMEYGMSRPNGMVPGYDPNRPMDGSVSPPDQQASPMPYSVDHGSQVHNYQSPMSMPPPKPFAGLDMNSPMQPHARQIPSLHSVGVSDSPDYRHYPYDAQPYAMNNSVPFTQANASSMNLPATFPPDTGHVSPSTADDRMNPPQILDPMRAKYGGQSFDYTNYL